MSKTPENSETLPPGEAALAELLGPLCELAVREGVKLQPLVDLLKRGLVDAALRQPEAAKSASPTEMSDSRLSVMTGVHRKDLRALRKLGALSAQRHRHLAAEIFARWLSDPIYRTRRGQPRVLARQSRNPSEPSFESLVAGISTDVHPRSVLDELIRLSLVVWNASAGSDTVKVIATAFTPSQDRVAQLRFLSANAADHLRAGCANLDQNGRAFLEQAIYSDELSEESAKQFNKMTLQAWEQAFGNLMPTLRELFKEDQSAGRAMNHRVRFGMYGFVAPVNEVSGPNQPAARKDIADV